MKILFIQSNYPNFLKSFHSNLKDGGKLTYSQVKKKWADEYFGSADFYLKNLKPLGWSGDEIILNDFEIQSKWMREHGLKLTHNMPNILQFVPERIKNVLGMNGWMKHAFFEQVKFHKPDVLYFNDVTIMNLSDFKFLRKYSKLIVGQIAYPLPLNKSILKEYDLMISSFPHFVKMFKKMGIKSEYLKWCAESTILKLIKPKNNKYNVSYVGGFSPHHSKGNAVLEEAAKKIKIDFWGYGDSFLSPLSPIKKNFHGEAWGRRMYQIFADSKIVVNRHINLSKNYANNMRMFDATLMGALLLTDEKSNMKEFFNVDREVVTYKNAPDLVNKIKYYQSHDKERRKIAKAGQARTLKEHTYKKRMKELDFILRSYLK